MTGYQEVLTNPSCYGQIVTMTYPLVGNYGINGDEVGLLKPQVKGLVVRELCNTPSNWRTSETLNEYLKETILLAFKELTLELLQSI